MITGEEIAELMDIRLMIETYYIQRVIRTFNEGPWREKFQKNLGSEAGAFACVYAILVGVLAYKELNWSKLVKTLENTVVDVGMVMLSISLFAIFSYGLIWDQIPQQMANFILGISSTPWVVMIIVILFYFSPAPLWTRLF